MGQYSMTRRVFSQFAEKAWFLLALFPWRAKAQPPWCPNCPNTYYSCKGHQNCGSGGYFILGCVFAVYFYTQNDCGYCTNAPLNPNYRCTNYLFRSQSVCNSVFYSFHWNQCCTKQCNFL
jgi:hypothetical protein